MPTALFNDPIHEKLWEYNRHQLIVWNRRGVISLKEQIRRAEHADHPKAISVPTKETGILPAKAFFAERGYGMSKSRRDITPLSDRHGDTATRYHS